VRTSAANTSTEPSNECLHLFAPSVHHPNSRLQSNALTYTPSGFLRSRTTSRGGCNTSEMSPSSARSPAACLPCSCAQPAHLKGMIGGAYDACDIDCGRGVPDMRERVCDPCVVIHMAAARGLTLS